MSIMKRYYIGAYLRTSNERADKNGYWIREKLILEGDPLHSPIGNIYLPNRSGDFGIGEINSIPDGAVQFDDLDQEGCMERFKEAYQSQLEWIGQHSDVSIEFGLICYYM